MLTRLRVAFWTILLVVVLSAINGCMTQQDEAMERLFNERKAIRVGLGHDSRAAIEAASA